MGPVSDKNRKSWIHVLILCIIYMFSSCVLYSPDMSCRQCARSPPHIPCCPLMSQFMFGGESESTNWLLTNPTSYWFPIGTVCLAASYYANITDISEHSPHLSPLLEILTKIRIKVFWAELKTYDPSSSPFLASVLFVPGCEAAVIY